MEYNDPNEISGKISNLNLKMKNMLEKNIDIDLGPMFDYREPQKLFDLLDELGLPYQKVELEIGDSVLSFDHVIEFKRIDAKQIPIKDDDGNFQYDENEKIITENNNDLRASLFDGRLHEQSKNRNEKFKWNALFVIVEKDAKCYDDYFTPKHWTSIQKTLSLCNNTHIFTFSSEKEAIIVLYEYYKEIKKGPYFIPPVNKQPRPKTLRENQIYFLSGLFDMGYKKCDFLLDIFQTPEEIIKWILTTQIRYTKSGVAKICKESYKIKGYGPKFFIKNKKLLRKVAEKHDSKEE
jgi:ERCC4-type nuclease